MAGPAFDAVSSPTPATGDLSWTHTPVGTPKGVLILVVQNGSDADRVVGATYGGTAMTEVTGSPVTATAGDEDGVVSGFFLGASVPTGAQTAFVDVDDAGTTKAAVCITVTATGDTAQDDTTGLASASLQNPSITVDNTTDAFIAAALFVALATPANITPAADLTELLEFDFGSQCCNFVRVTTNPGAGATAVAWTTNAADDVAVLGVAIKDAATNVTVVVPAASVASSAPVLVPALDLTIPVASVAASAPVLVPALTLLPAAASVASSAPVAVLASEDGSTGRSLLLGVG